MFDALSDRLQAALGDVRSRGKLTEDDVNEAMRQVRLALLEADVNFKVVKQFTAGGEGAGARSRTCSTSLNPGQQVVKIVSDELTALMGGSGRDLALAKPGPTVILMAGPPGLGQDDRRAASSRGTCARSTGWTWAWRPATSTARPPSTSSSRWAQQAGAHVYEQGTGRDPVDIAEWALDQAKQDRRDALIVDTSGRLHIDEELMKELAEIKKRTKPHNVLLVVDAMTGQDAVNVAEQFAETANFDGVILTKLDGDSRGGAALSVKAVTGKPILYASTGEKLGDFERFHPDRMAQRILGMGDVMTLVEKAEKQMDERQAAELERKIRKEQFTLDDFLEQMQQVRNMGPLGNLLKMMPGVGSQLGNAERGREGARPARGDHPVDDAGGAGEPEDHRRVAAAPDRARVGDQRPGRVAARQAVRPDAEGDEAGGGAGRCRRCSSWRAAAESLTSPGLCPYESASPAWGARRIRSGAWSSPTSARRAMAASSRRSATTTRRPSPRRS